MFKKRRDFVNIKDCRGVVLERMLEMKKRKLRKWLGNVLVEGFLNNCNEQ